MAQLFALWVVSGLDRGQLASKALERPVDGFEPKPVVIHKNCHVIAALGTYQSLLEWLCRRPRHPRHRQPTPHSAKLESSPPRPRTPDLVVSDVESPLNYRWPWRLARLQFAKSPLDSLLFVFAVNCQRNSIAKTNFRTCFCKIRRFCCLGTAKQLVLMRIYAGWI